MMMNSKTIVIGLSLIFSVIGWKTYWYFFDTTFPVVTISGMERGGYYAGDAQCVIGVSDGYKVRDISIFLDTKPLVARFKIGRKQDEHVFTIPTRTLSDGAHSLKIEVRDASYRTNTTIENVAFYVDNRPLQAAFVKSVSDIKVFQGKTLHLQFQVSKPIKQAIAKTLSKTITCVPESENSLVYECFIPISCEEVPQEHMLSIEITDVVGSFMTLDTKFQVVMFPFRHQNLSISQDKLHEAENSGKPEKEFDELMIQLTSQSPVKKLWRGLFYAPIEIRHVSTEFGTVRVTQHRGKYPHNAVDLIGMPKTVVWAPQDGVIVLKDSFVHSGNTVVIDHGCGILSLFFHLESFANISVGDKVRKGNPLGTLGKTGYATGYHLHWEMRINNVPVDPMQWIRNEF